MQHGNGENKDCNITAIVLQMKLPLTNDLELIANL